MRCWDSWYFRIVVCGCLTLSAAFLTHTATGCVNQTHYTWFYASAGANGPSKAWETEAQCMSHWTNEAAEDPFIDCVDYYQNKWKTYHKDDCQWGCFDNNVKQDASLMNAGANPLNVGNSDYCHCAPPPGHGGGVGGI